MSSKSCPKAAMLIGIVAIVNVMPCVSLAHEDSNTRVAQLNQLLLDSPNNIEALLRRADHHRRDQDRQLALRDYKAVAKQDDMYPGYLLGMAKLSYDQGDFAKSLEWSQSKGSAQTLQSELLWMQGRAHLKLKSINAADRAFQQSLSMTSDPKPEMYYEYANAVAMDDRPESLAHAIDILEGGLIRLPNAINLHSKALQLEIRTNDLQAALRRTNSVLEEAPYLHDWRLKQAEILIKTKRIEPARAELLSLIQAIDQLPSIRRATARMQEIKQSALQMLEALEG